MIILKGAEVSAKIRDQVHELLKELDGKIPRLAIVRVGEKPDDLSYERGAIKKITAFGMEARSYAFPEDVDNEEFQKEFRKINEDPEVSGILLLKPLPDRICQEDLDRIIDPSKDLDGISPVNIAKVFAGDGSGFAPCTAEAVVETLKAYEIPIAGKRAVIVGRSMVVGKPLAMLLMKEHATVTVCHTRTVDLPGTCRNGEILVAAAGRAKMIGRDHTGPGAVVIDVGINVGEDGKLCGDVDLEAIEDIGSMATPVPGGVGAVTTAVLARHLALAAVRTKTGSGR
jgi:methylenetetrahydrofolate dehydrogenase (NADP+)/methenyltetrahydrofolate cyclohydrolase